jgi:hypothetical protein
MRMHALSKKVKSTHHLGAVHQPIFDAADVSTAAADGSNNSRNTTSATTVRAST